MGKTLRPGGLSLLEHALEHYPFNPGSRVLDIGCGLGATVDHLRNKWELRAAGLDMSRKLLMEGARCAPTIPLLQARAEALPVVDNSCDGLVCECVLSLVSDPSGTLGEFYRILVPGGRFILSDIYRRNSLNSDQVVSCRCCLDGASTREQLLDWLGQAGFVLRCWEDHSYLLAELAAKLIFLHGSMADFWQGVAGANDGHQMEQAIRSMRPGYYLIVAEKY
jgi:ubiquinone/menaquinone biosynthesis C-methylase UbiE